MRYACGMPRIARIVVPGLPHHVTQRGNNRQAVFFTDDDRLVYLRLLKEQSDHLGLSILAYCLMSNHVHIVALPRTAEALATALGRTHWLYTRYVNHLHGRSGHLWQNRFDSCALDQEHLLHAVCYAERNPVRARLVRLPWRYRWSSAAAHIGESDSAGVLDHTRWKEMFTPAQWRKVLQRPEDQTMTLRIRHTLKTGRPLGSDRFIAKLEAKIGKRLRAMPMGRPPKPKPTKTKKKASGNR